MSDWVTKDPESVYNVKCTSCNIIFSIGKSSNWRGVFSSMDFHFRIFSIMNSKSREERKRPSLALIKNELLIYINLKLDCEKSYGSFI